MTFSLNGKILLVVNIIAENDIDKINLFNMSKKIYYKWIDLLRT